MPRRKGNARDDGAPYENMQTEDMWADRPDEIDLRLTKCTCGHWMNEHILDWDLDPDIDCRHEGCTCPEFEPVRA